MVGLGEESPPVREEVVTLQCPELQVYFSFLNIFTMNIICIFFSVEVVKMSKRNDTVILLL